MGVKLTEENLRSALSGLGIVTQSHEHPAVFTVEDSAEIHATIPGAHTKNLFLKDAGGQFWLVTVHHATRVDLKALPGAIGSRKLSFGKAEDMATLLGVTPGAVTPLAAINDTAGRVRVVIDAALAQAPCVNVHPLRNTATMAITGGDLLRALSAWDHPPVIVAIPQREIAEAT